MILVLLMLVAFYILSEVCFFRFLDDHLGNFLWGLYLVNLSFPFKSLLYDVRQRHIVDFLK